MTIQYAEPMGALEDDRTNPELLPVHKPLPVATIAGVNVEALLEKAVDAKAAVEVLERLMVMRRELAAESAKAAFDRAMAAFQAECPVIVKSEVVHQKNSTAVRYRYAPLDVIVAQVKGLLEKHGLSHTETAQVEKEWVTAVCTVKHNQGHSEKSEFKVPIDPEAYMNAAQKFASALTFAKRYAFCNALGILTGDVDDDSRASGDPTEGRQATFTRSKAQNSSQPPPGHAVKASSASGPVPEAPKPTPPRPATPETRQKLIDKLNQAGMGMAAIEYFQKLENPTPLMPNETLAQLDLRFVPVTESQFRALGAAISAFSNGDPAKHAYPPNDLPAPSPTQGSTPASPQSTPAGVDPTKESWYHLIVHVPPRGMKKAAYMAGKPDTIGSLYEARHTDEQARKRLFGFVHSYEPTGFTKDNGEKVPPSQHDIKLRHELSNFRDYFARTHPDEKL